MKIDRRAAVALACLTVASMPFLTVASTALPPLPNCGTWVFSGTPESTPGDEYSDQFPLSSAFTYTCGCNVQIDAMIQITMVYDEVDQTFLYAASGDQDRANADGWTIDRVNGEGEGWYGLLNDGKTFYAGWNTTGGNNTPNTLIDQPGGWANNIIFYAVDVAICFQSNMCPNNIFGFFMWSYRVDNNANASSFLITPINQWMWDWQPGLTFLNINPLWAYSSGEFYAAVAGWNAWAPTSPPQNYGGDPTSLPHAVPLPTFWL